MKKRCYMCKKLKSVKEFCLDKSRKDGLCNRCKKCDCQRVKTYRKKPGIREKHNAHMMLYNRTYTKTIKFKRWRRNFENQKARTNSMFCLARRISSAIRLTLYGNKEQRKWQKLVGYTVDDLKQHLEKQFQSGMTWNNYGEWHIDHIIPISAFNFTQPEDIGFKQCWALENLQPLWAKDNLMKSNKILGGSIYESKLTG